MRFSFVGLSRSSRERGFKTAPGPYPAVGNAFQRQFILAVFLCSTGRKRFTFEIPQGIIVWQMNRITMKFKFLLRENISKAINFLISEALGQGTEVLIDS